MTELKPCPFCGGDNIDIIPADIILGTQYWRVYCYGCGCTQTPTSDKEDSIETWNNRPNPWHTGTPTDEGWYILHYPKSIENPYELAKWNGSKFVAVKPFHAIIVYIEADTVPMWHNVERLVRD